MSAFMVSTETIHEVVRVMLDGGKSLGRPYEDRHEAGTKIGQRLIKMNAEAVGCRYGGEDCDTSASYVYREVIRLGTRKELCQTVKALDCYLYQCTEGNVPSKRLYKEVESFRDELARRIVQSLTEYETAEWDMRPPKANGLVRLV